MDKDVDVIRQLVLEEMDLTREVSDAEISAMIHRQIARYSKHHMLSIEQREGVQRDVFHSLRRLSVLQELVDDKTITEIMVNGIDHIFYEKTGQLFRWDKQFSSQEELDEVIQQIAGLHNRAVNESSPIVDTRLGDGSRVNIVMSPVAVEGASISIRKFPEHPLDMEGLIRLGALSQEVVDDLAILVRAGYNIFI